MGQKHDGGGTGDNVYWSAMEISLNWFSNRVNNNGNRMPHLTRVEGGKKTNSPPVQLQ